MSEVFGEHSGTRKAGRPERAVLAFTRLERKIFFELKPGGRGGRPLIGGMTDVTEWPDLVLAGPIIGAPQAAMVMEDLSRGGVTTFLSLGWCGSLQPDLGWGEIVLPESSLCEEGTSAHYGGGGSPATADPALVQRLAVALESDGHGFHRGAVWTTDAPYRETWDKVRDYRLRGLLGVDMETSALMSVARFRGLSWAGLLVVSDEMGGETWRPGFKSKELKNGLGRAARCLLNVAEELE